MSKSFNLLLCCISHFFKLRNPGDIILYVKKCEICFYAQKVISFGKLYVQLFRCLIRVSESSLFDLKFKIGCLFIFQTEVKVLRTETRERRGIDDPGSQRERKRSWRKIWREMVTYDQHSQWGDAIQNRLLQDLPRPDIWAVCTQSTWTSPHHHSSARPPTLRCH
jgi:hypothetical protein